MIKRVMMGLALAMVMSFSMLPQQSHAQQQSFNWFDPASWMGAPMGGAQMGGVPQFNLATPNGWAVFMNPQTYPAMMNPATYSQFMQPQFWMQFANPNNMMSWMNPGAYSAFMNPMSYMQWMNPGSYMAFMNPATYMQPMNPGAYAAYMNPNTYMQWMNPAAYAIPAGGAQGAAAMNWFDPNAWTQMMAPQAAPAQDAAAAPKK